MRYSHLSLIFLLLYVPVFTQSVRYEDYIYKNNIRSVFLHPADFEMGLPVLDLNNPAQQLLFSFDDLDADVKNYSIYFIHCDAYWNPSDLMTSEYIDGFFELNILNYAFSQNTLQKYTHYDIKFPTANCRFTKAGNYLLVLYETPDKNKIVATRRFYVLNNVVDIAAQISQPIGNDLQYVGQHLDFTISSRKYELTNPVTDMKIMIMQNGRQDNMVKNIPATFMTGNAFQFNLDDRTTFPGSNEFRYFDIRTLFTYTERIANIFKDDNNKWHVYLTKDEPRFKQKYAFQNDLNGNFLIRNNDRLSNPDIEADYAYVHFQFHYPYPISKGNVYILSRINNWMLTNENKMTYNESTQSYECTMYLKQGYYNYIYAIQYDNDTKCTEWETEGNYWQTENDYYIFVYHKPRGFYYDQLVGLLRINTLKR
ncbi:MAG: DUF5103 domain-containing protein [Bacteroidetes bacterium]|nr:MAG: DUF5103 domain-containing protein [Bacteroidota bacterium]